MSPSRVEAVLSVGENAISLRIRGQSSPRVAAILGRERGAHGYERLWLDRIVHEEHLEIDGGWTASGAFVTELVRPAGAGPASSASAEVEQVS